MIINKNIKKTFFALTAITALVAVPLNGNLSFGYGNNGGGSSTPSKCEESKPANAPRLLSAVASGTNEVTLNWTQANDPVTYYLVTFGNKPGEQLYGNPNVGGKGTTSFTVSHLSGNQTYYFRVRAGNGCMPGDYSNEVSGKAYGANLTSNVPAGFQPGVLGESIKNTPVLKDGKPTEKPQGATNTPVSDDNTKTTNENVGFFQSIINFFKHLFGGN